MAPKKTLTLRQIEIIRAVMVVGSIGGAARLLNVAQPGVSRSVKHLESVLGIKLFVRRGGRYAPTPEAHDIFVQLQEVQKKIDDLQYSIEQLGRGNDVKLSIGTVPSIGQVMVPSAVAELKSIYPDIVLDIELLRAEEAIDFLMLGRGELVCAAGRLDHPMIELRPLAEGELVLIAHPSHPLASRRSVSAEDIARYPLIGFDPTDTVGSVMAGIFAEKGLSYRVGVKARIESTVMELVRQDLGVAVLDSFTVASIRCGRDGLVVVPLQERPRFETWVASRADSELGSHAETFVDILRRQMRASQRKAGDLGWGRSEDEG